MATPTAAAYSDLSDGKAVGAHLAAQIERRLHAWMKQDEASQ